MNAKRIHSLRLLIQLTVLFTIILGLVLYFLEVSYFLPLRNLNVNAGFEVLYNYFFDSTYTFRGLSQAVFLTIAIFTAAFIGGRFFCGWLCPVGTTQDLIYLAGKFVRFKQFRVHERYTFVKFFVLCLLIVLTIREIKLPTEAFFYGFIVFIIIFSLFASRVFCRIFCPVGAWQALVSYIGVKRITKNNNCNLCNRCTNNCPVEIESTKSSNSATPECIACLNCFKSNCDNQFITICKRSIRPKFYIISMLSIFVIIWMMLPWFFRTSQNLANTSAYQFNDGIYYGSAIGFGGELNLKVEVFDNQIVNIEVISHSETLGWFEQPFKQLPKEIIKKQSWQVDTITGATYSSNGILDAVYSALKENIKEE